MAADNNRLYVTDGAKVYIYSLKDFKLLKNFGSEGEGPQEFKRRITHVSVQPDHLFFNSVGKVSYFTKEGKFIKEFRTSGPGMRLKPFGDGFAIGKMTGDKGVLYYSVSVHDAKLTKLWDVHKQQLEVQLGGKGTRPYTHALPFYVYKDKLFSAKGTDLVIDVFDRTGKKLYSISRDYKKLKITDGDKDRVIHHLKTSREFKDYFEAIKPITFPDYFPAIRNYSIADDRVYVFTYKREGEKTECLIFDIDGKYLKRRFILCSYIDPVDEYPFVIKNGNFYQLIENEETEEWDLHISPIDGKK
jgi:hypothetical protein